MGRAMALSIKRFQHSVWEERWGSVAVGIILVLDIWWSLKCGWNVDVMLTFALEELASQNDAVPFQVQRYSQTVSVVDSYLKSDQFYCWCLGMRATPNMLDKSIHWNEGCDCHFEFV